MKTITTEAYQLPLVYTPNPYAQAGHEWDRLNSNDLQYAHQIQVNHTVRVEWSNGAGYSLYRVVDNPGSGPHLWVLLSEKEYV